MGEIALLALLAGGMFLKNKVTPPHHTTSSGSGGGISGSGASFPAFFSQSNPAANSISGNSGQNMFQEFVRNLAPNFGAVSASVNPNAASVNPNAAFSGGGAGRPYIAPSTIAYLNSQGPKIGGFVPNAQGGGTILL